MKGSRIVVMPMMQSRESQKTGLEYDEIELAVFDLCFYIIPHIIVWGSCFSLGSRRGTSASSSASSSASAYSSA